MRVKLTLILLLASLLLHAEPLTLDSCLQLALDNNVSIRKADLSLMRAQEVRREALTKYFPQVDASGFAFHALHPLLEASIDDVDNTTARELLNTLYDQVGEPMGFGRSIAMFHHGVHASVTAVQPIFMGGKIIAGNKLSRLGVEAAELQQDIARRDALLEVEEAYWLVVCLREKEQLLQSMQDMLDTVSLFVDAAVEAGLAVENDRLRVRLKQSELRSHMIELSDALPLAQRALCRTIGIPYSDSVSVVLPPLPDQEMQLEAAQPAQNVQPERQLLHLNLQAEELRKHMSVADALPQIVLMGAYGYGNMLNPEGIPGTDPWKWNGALAVTMRVPLTGWWETAHKIREHDYAIREAQLTEQDMSEALELRHIQSSNALHTQLAVFEQKQLAYRLSEENFSHMRDQYSAGLATISELLEAQTLLEQSRTELIDARTAYLIALHRAEKF